MIHPVLAVIVANTHRGTQGLIAETGLLENNQLFPVKFCSFLPVTKLTLDYENDVSD